MLQPRRRCAGRGLRRGGRHACAGGGGGSTAAAVDDARVARLATIDAQGRPHVVPICFALDGDTLYSAVDEKPKRTRALRRLHNIEANPIVEVLIDHYDEDWSQLWWVRLRGRARVVERDDHALGLLTAKYAQYREHPPSGPVIVVAIESRSEWQAS